jgi:hypothetical protein
MSDGGLHHRVDALLASAFAIVFDWPEYSPLRQAVMEERDRLGRPMRVALAGLVKAGKSTLVNALLGQRLVATGADETTFNVNWLSYGEAPSLEVDFKDEAGRPPESRRFAHVGELTEALDSLTRRSGGDANRLSSIRHIRARFPQPLLRTFEVIDTPGLESVFGTDAANARTFLAMRERTSVTRAESSAADAVLYLFKGNLGAADLLSLGELQDPALAGATPLNTLGALTMADTFWPAEGDPIEHARTIIRSRHANLPQLGRTFYTVLPVAGECALGAATLTDADFDTVRSLAAIPADRLHYYLRSQSRFCDWEDADLPALPARRAVWDRLSRWGVWVASGFVRGGVGDRASLADRLEDASGVRALRRLLVTHFGCRSHLLQVYRVCNHVVHACGQEQMGADRRRQVAAAGLAASFERLALQEPAFDELRLLGGVYSGRLVLMESERADVLAVTGELGGDPATRLGLTEPVRQEELLELAGRKQRYWHLRSGDVLGDPSYKDAARVLAAAYGRLLRRLVPGEE